MTVHDARKLQESEGLSEKDFFEKHGFCLLKHETKVKDWNIDYTKEDTDIKNIYHAEIEELARAKIFTEGNH